MAVQLAPVTSSAARLATALALAIYRALEGVGAVAALTADASTSQRKLKFLKISA